MRSYKLTIFTAVLLLQRKPSKAVSCSDTSIGVENPAIFPNNRFSSSTVYDGRFLPYMARLYGTHGWAPKIQTNHNDYLQIDFGTQYTLCAIRTQGSGDTIHEWVTRYEVMVSLNKRSWTSYNENGRNKVFTANIDSDSIVKNTLKYRPAARYIRIIPKGYRNYKTIRVGIYGHRKGGSSNNLVDVCVFDILSSQAVTLVGVEVLRGIFTMKIPISFAALDVLAVAMAVICKIIERDCTRVIGLENKEIIPDDRFSASSYYSQQYIPSNGRLNAVVAWETKTNIIPNEYLQVDLGIPYIVCAIATQGSGKLKEWVLEFKIASSVDNSRWTPYKESGVEKIFPGSIEQDIIQRQPINDALMRFIRIIPTKYHNHKALRVELFGTLEACDSKALGMQSRTIANHLLSASSSHLPANNARLQSPSSWCARSSDRNPYLQVDLGSNHVICGIATQGNNAADQWVKLYQISISLDGRKWTNYIENGRARKFFANYDRTTVVRRLLYNSPTTRYIRILPQTYHGAVCLRLEIYGYQIQTFSSASVGIPSSSLVPDHRFTATSFYASDFRPLHGRLGGTRAWATKTNDKDNEYLQIDLGGVYLICKVLTQGSPVGSYWVSRFQVSFAMEGGPWTAYTERGRHKEFTGNTDKKTVVTNFISSPFKAKFVRVIPTAYYQHKSMRVELKGMPVGCTTSLGLENYQIPDSYVTSSSHSDSTHDAPRGRLYSESSWCSSTTSNREYIQVDLERVKSVTGIATQGDHVLNKWMMSYKVSYSFRRGVWYDYKENQSTKTFTGNSNRNDVIVNWLSRPIAARYVRIHPYVSKNGHCLRFELFGCNFYSSPPRISVNVSSLVLPSTKDSYKTISCVIRGEVPRVQWFRNNIRIINAKETTLSVHFFSAEDVVTKYRCSRQSMTSRLVVCKADYQCRVSYIDIVPSSTGVYKATAQVSVYLNVPEAPLLTAVSHRRMITINWNIFNVTDDVGTIQHYIIQLKNLSYVTNIKIQPPNCAYNLTYLRPYTNFTIRVQGITKLGIGLWSSLKTIRTKIAEPDGIPLVTRFTAVTSQSMRVDWQFTQLEKVNGPMAGFKIIYTKQDETKKIDVGDVRTYNLTSLEKNTYYNVTVSVKNSIYLGRPSSTQRQKTMEDAPECVPVLMSTQSFSATSVLIIWTSLQDLKCTNGVLRGYKIVYRSRDEEMSHSRVFLVNSPAAMTAVVPGLNESTEYMFQVLGFTVKDGLLSNKLHETPLPIGNLSIESNKMAPLVRAGYNETVSIGCYATGYHPITYRWSKDLGLVAALKVYRNVLVVKVETAMDYGKYVCYVTNLKGESVSYGVDLQPLVTCNYNVSTTGKNVSAEKDYTDLPCTPATKATFTTGSFKILQEKMAPLIKAEPGDRVILGCHATGNQPITYTWSKDGFPLVRFSDTVHVLDNTVVVSQVAAKDFGIYVCNVTNGQQSASYSMKLERFTKIKVSNHEASFDATQTQDCKTSYIPFAIALAILSLVLFVVIMVYLRYRRTYRKKHLEPYLAMTDMSGRHHNKSSYIRKKLKKLVRSDIHCYEILGEESEVASTQQHTTVNIYTNPIVNSTHGKDEHVNT